MRWTRAVVVAAFAAVVVLLPSSAAWSSVHASPPGTPVLAAGTVGPTTPPDPVPPDPEPSPSATTPASTTSGTAPPTVVQLSDDDRLLLTFTLSLVVLASMTSAVSSLVRRR